MRLNLDAIECRSAFDDAPETAVREIAGPSVAGGAAIRVVERILSIERPTRFERAVFTTAISHANIAEYPLALDVLRNLVAQRLAPGASRHGSRLWLERNAMLRNGDALRRQPQ